MHHQSRLSDLSEAEFDALIEAYIARLATSADELPLDVFMDLLIERTTANTKAPVTRVIGEVTVTCDPPQDG
jgi:hypothetical protein